MHTAPNNQSDYQIVDFMPTRMHTNNGTKLQLNFLITKYFNLLFYTSNPTRQAKPNTMTAGEQISAITATTADCQHYSKNQHEKRPFTQSKSAPINTISPYNPVFHIF